LEKVLDWFVIDVFNYLPARIAIFFGQTMREKWRRDDRQTFTRKAGLSPSLLTRGLPR
jgi:hypothetical protein